MRVDWNEKVCGLNIRSIRDALRSLGNSFRAEDIAEELHITLAKARSVIRELKQRAWLEPVPKDQLSVLRGKKRVQFLQLTITGNGFVMAPAVKRISRKEAVVRLNRFVKRIKAINANDDYGWYVDEARVFGSYLDKAAADLGDVDIALSLKWRPIIGRGKVAHSEERARASGKIIKNYIQRLTYAEREVRLRLKNRDPYISMHEISELQEMQTTSKTIYRAPKSASKPRRRSVD